ncbi:SDR family oxidoreductase [Oceanidesulfovibrio marinus]|uniref:SDR family oxidoreductase n=1 Tax=Oceanidesulfovibrio marinus TaxID=370038 RepID=A0ABX6NFP5_9BACT|nr:SDR family oxidoreductase [Oceanidesulfovibrio marinus]QJT09450.1 SDR family oxidoreductase [Oceanidesulfovibrio marinus]
MRIFVTGATGFIGSHVVKELIDAGYDVLGMTRSAEGEKTLAAMGADIHRATLEDVEGLRKGADSADAVIHLGFNHNFAKFAESCKIDQQAIEALGAALANSDRTLIVPSVMGGLTSPGQVATEDMVRPEVSPLPRVSEQTAQSLQGVDAVVVRLAQVHNTVRQGLVTNAIAIAREKGMSAYVEDGMNRWAAVHVRDVARLFRLVLEQHEKGAIYHAVAEEGIPMRVIATAIGLGLNVPVKSIPSHEAQDHFGWFATFASHSMMASSAITRKKLGWAPSGPGLISDLEQMDY